MDLTSLFGELEDLRHTTGHTDKQDILEALAAGENEKILRSMSEFVFNPYRKVYVKVTDDVLDFADPDCIFDTIDSDEEIWGHFVVLLRKLEQRSITGNEARKQVASFLASVHDDYRDWFIAILNKDLKIGVGQKMIERVLPGLVPKFSVQLCPSKQWDGSIPAGGVFVTPKIDGIRGIIGPFGEDDKYVSLSRNGKPLNNTQHIIDWLAGIAKTFHRREGMWPVFDGEFYTHGWELSSSITSTKTDHPEAHKLNYHVFDILTMPEWATSKGKLLFVVRDKILANMMTYAPDHIIHVPGIFSHDREEIEQITQAYVDEGYEGSVLKGAATFYEFKRSKAWVKFKPFHDDDLLIVDVDKGWLDSTNNVYDDGDPRVESKDVVRVVRSLIVERNGIRTNVGSGLSRDQRVTFAQEVDQLLGKTATIRYQRVSEDGRLIFPRLKGIRSDK